MVAYSCFKQSSLSQLMASAFAVQQGVSLGKDLFKFGFFQIMPVFDKE